MQFKIFRVSLDNISDDEEILNKFLRSARPLTVRCDFAESKNCYCYSVEYLDAVGGSDNSNPQFSKNKIDYREVLSLEEFSKFRVLREIRKAISEEDKIPPFAIFNDKQMAEIAKGEAVSLTAIKSVKPTSPLHRIASCTSPRNQILSGHTPLVMSRVTPLLKVLFPLLSFLC
jgi:superfamily II DNA helicase RecQ